MIQCVSVVCVCPQYFDDMNWMSLALLRATALTKKDYTNTAVALFDKVPPLPARACVCVEFFCVCM